MRITGQKDLPFKTVSDPVTQKDLERLEKYRKAIN